MNTIYNLEAMAGVIISGKVICKELSWRPAKKGWFSKSDEYFICTDTEEQYSAEQLRNGEYNGKTFIVEDGHAYYKPFVEILFSNPRLDKRREFDTYEEARTWGTEQANQGIKVKLTLNEST